MHKILICLVILRVPLIVYCEFALFWFFLQALSHLQNSNPAFLNKILPKVKVYARVAPKQKVIIFAFFTTTFPSKWKNLSNWCDIDISQLLYFCMFACFCRAHRGGRRLRDPNCVRPSVRDAEKTWITLQPQARLGPNLVGSYSLRTSML